MRSSRGVGAAAAATAAALCVVSCFALASAASAEGALARALGGRTRLTTKLTSGSPEFVKGPLYAYALPAGGRGR
jgi:hypothetical protein